MNTFMPASFVPDPQVMEKWAAALEGGGYLQGKGGLAYRTSDGEYRYCCLGVLCELAIENGVKVAKTMQPEGPDRDDVAYGGEISIPPYEVAAWAFGTVEVANPPLGSVTATHWNDVRDATFPLIAAMIRRDLIPGKE